MGKWSQPDNPPPPLFTGQKEKDLVKQVNDELIERVIGQVTIADLDRHNHRVKSQAKNPFRPPPRNWM